MPDPYFADDTVSLYLGDCREVLPALGVTADLVLADPPYGETSLAWDRWPDGWLQAAAAITKSLWCFGSMRMFGERWPDFGRANWKLSQDLIGADSGDDPVFGDVHVVWEKNTGTGRATDRFRRVHEHVLHWYQGAWGGVYHETPRVPATPEQIARNGSAVRTSTGTAHTGNYGARAGWGETGVRLMRSVIRTPTMRGKAIHPTEKPAEPLLRPLVEYACPPGGLVVDPFTGSGSTLAAARMSGRRAIGIEANEKYAEKAAQRLAQAPLDFEEVAHA
ncbi:MAG: modification methylase [Nocardioides sp.]|nr:modification methylase [Nocardioides sp.]